MSFVVITEKHPWEAENLLGLFELVGYEFVADISWV